MMRIKNLNQSTKLWYQHRKKYINASEIASITGLDPFRPLEQLVRDKLTKAPQGYRVKKLRPDYKRYLKKEKS
uniref:Endonuclease n=1 Tax=Candidatus Phytoplasma citri TaxID=180978 RepID=A0A077D365_9MOLU|nr:hypothetical protein [Candidatus Phytoplasma aurantifolia]